MAKLSLSLAFAPNPRSMPILDGTVEAEGIALACSRISPGEQFHRQLTHQEFDVSEMSISSLLMITAAGDTNWVALPIFTTRYFFGTTAIARNGAGIDSPDQMKGKRVGVNEYQMTAALWSRGFFHHEYGVEATGVNIVARAVSEPLRQLAINAGLEGSVIVKEVGEKKGNQGYNIDTDKYVDMLEAGILDPTKVTRSALQNAASISGLLLTTECLITEIPEDTPSAPPAGPPGGGM